MEIVSLPSDREVIVRPIRASDGPELNAAYDRLSPQSKYRRFLAAKPHLSDSDTRYLVQVDGEDHFALVATPVEDRTRILGVARFVRLPKTRDRAEFAIVVGDDVQREGLSGKLMERLAQAATDRGVTHFTATMLAENGPAHRMARRIPGRVVSQRHEGTVDELEIELAA